MNKTRFPFLAAAALLALSAGILLPSSGARADIPGSGLAGSPLEQDPGTSTGNTNLCPLNQLEALSPLRELRLSKKKAAVLERFFQNTLENEQTRTLDQQLSTIASLQASASPGGAREAARLIRSLEYQKQEEAYKILSLGSSSLLASLEQELGSRKASAAIRKAEKNCIRCQEACSGYGFQKGSSLLSKAQYRAIQSALSGHGQALETLSALRCIQNSQQEDTQEERSLIETEFLPKAKEAFQNALVQGSEGIFARSELEFFLKADAQRSEGAAAIYDAARSDALSLRTNSLSRTSGRILDAHILWLDNQLAESGGSSGTSYTKKTGNSSLREELAKKLGMDLDGLPDQSLAGVLFFLQSQSGTGNPEAASLLSELAEQDKYKNLCIFPECLPGGTAGSDSEEPSSWIPLSTVASICSLRCIQSEHGETILSGPGCFYSFMEGRSACLLSKSSSRLLAQKPVNFGQELAISPEDAYALFSCEASSIPGSGLCFCTTPTIRQNAKTLGYAIKPFRG